MSPPNMGFGLSSPNPCHCVHRQLLSPHRLWPHWPLSPHRLWPHCSLSPYRLWPQYPPTAFGPTPSPQSVSPLPPHMLWPHSHPTGCGPTASPQAVAPLPPTGGYCRLHLPALTLRPPDWAAGTRAPYCTEEEEENPLIDSRHIQLFGMGRRPSSTESLASHCYCELFTEAQLQISPCVTSSWESRDSATPALNTVHCALTLNTSHCTLNTVH